MPQTRASRAKSLLAKKEKGEGSTKSGGKIEKVSKSKSKSSTKASASEAKSNGDIPNEGYWLIKAESESRIENGVDVKFSIDDMQNEKVAEWDGIRNYAARNFMRQMKKGDLCLYYHSNTKKTRPGVVGVVKVHTEAFPDHTAFDKKAPYFDPKSDPDNPRWDMVKVEFVRKFESLVTLDDLKAASDLKDMFLFTRARLSVLPVRKSEFESILAMADK
mmetsp:Transcript_40665/g.105568  ORF Transcript_40665/g.105568 Transcript_40665/m.105568 type:complete len:218 (-) Transcript_40665:205-858(-)